MQDDIIISQIIASYADEDIFSLNIQEDSWQFTFEPNDNFTLNKSQLFWNNWINNEDHYLKNGKIFQLCGNYSASL